MKGSILEKASTVATLVFDKTGTLTVVTDVSVLACSEIKEHGDRRANEDYLPWLRGSLERNSGHPFAFVQPKSFGAGRGACGTY